MPVLDWIGKDKVMNHHLVVPYHVLDRQYSFDEQGTHEDDNGSENMIIHGDNLLALKSLLPQYEGRVNCIYIDPPYNTSHSTSQNQRWVYNDNVDDPLFLKWLGEVVGDEGEDLSRHDKWLCMMYPRLRLLHRLLSDDGVIFISIDNNEQARLKLLCDEVFGNNNFIETIVWDKKAGAKGVPPKSMLVNVHEYILVYSKSGKFSFTGANRDADADGFSNPDNDPRGPWRMSNIKSTTKSPEEAFTIVDPDTGKEYTNTWAFSQESLEKMIQEKRILWKESLPKQKEFLYEMTNPNKAIKSTWGVFDAQSTTVYLKNALPEFKFDNPKPIPLMEYLIRVATKPGDIILDSFAGSGTTAHAVLDVNKEDNGNRKFILIELMDYADSFTAKRVKNVITGYQKEITETLFDEAIDESNLDKGAQLLKEAKEVAKKAKETGSYSSVFRPKMEDGHLRVIAVKKAKDQVPGVPGDFSYYELGETLLKNELLNEDVDIDKIREYVYFTETKQRVFPLDENEPYLLGRNTGNAYYFYYRKGYLTTLDRDFLHTIKTKSEGYVIYADLCTLSERELEKYHITFKKIPRNIPKM